MFSGRIDSEDGPMKKPRRTKKQNHDTLNTNNYDAVRLVMHILHWWA